MAKKIVVLGGSFNPPTKAHMALLKAASTPADFPPLGFAEWAKATSKSSMRGMQTVLKKIYELNNEIFAKWAHGEDAGVSGGLGDREAFLTETRVYSTPFDVSCEFVSEEHSWYPKRMLVSLSQ